MLLLVMKHGSTNIILRVKQSSVWRFPGEDNPTKVKRQRSAGKQMIATFFAKWVHVTTIPLVERKTQNGILKFACHRLLRNATASSKNVPKDKFYGIMIRQAHTLLQEHWTHLQRMIYSSSHTLRIPRILHRSTFSSSRE